MQPQPLLQPSCKILLILSQTAAQFPNTQSSLTARLIHEYYR